MSVTTDVNYIAPIFRSVSSSTRQLFQLLNCIRFANNVHVQINNDGLRFAVEDSRVMQGVVFLDKALFTTYSCNLPQPNPGDEAQAVSPELPNFQVSLSALLETLQIFGVTDSTSSRHSKLDNDYNSHIRPGRLNAFSNQALGMAGVCRLSYESLGSPLSIILEESGVTTTCHINTYQPEILEEIPFQRDAMQVKIIMQARWLFDAISELSSTSPTRLDISVFPASPYLCLSAVGPLGSVSVEFSNSRDLLETFTVADCWTQSFKFEMIKASAEATRLASKVSIRGDEQGVLCLQFMVEVEGGGISFIDFRFIPFIRDEEDEGINEMDHIDEGDLYLGDSH